MKHNIGIIGAGNMATAIMHGAYTAGLLDGVETYVYDVNREATAALCSKIGGKAGNGNMVDLLNSCDIILLAVKPNALDAVLDEMRGRIDLEKTALISIVTGATVYRMKQALGENCRILRIMPNTPLLCGCGASCFSMPTDFLKEEYEIVYRIFSSQGIDIVTAGVKAQRCDRIERKRPRIWIYADRSHGRWRCSKRSVTGGCVNIGSENG